MHEPTHHTLEEENQLVKIRLQKLEQLRALGLDPFAIERYEITHALQTIHDDYEQLEGKTVSIAGRIVSLRKMGKATFAHLMDSTGKLQIYLKADEQGERYDLIDLWDLGDYVGVQGFVFKTRTGEVTVHGQSFVMLAKAIRPVPFPKEKGEQRWYELHDVEQRYRQRYLDLLVNPDSRRRLIARCRMVREIRRFLDERGFLEVETPVLQPMAGGAAARPFITHHNALNREFQLRIALELYLKRLLIGGIDRVYEIGRVFRNEGISTRHNPEFTMLELYQAYANLEDIMSLVEELFRHVAERVFGTTVFEMHGVQVDFAQPWGRVRLMDAIREHTGLTESDFETLERAAHAAEKVGISVERKDTVGGIIEKVLEKCVAEHLQQPTFVYGFPIDTSPLAKREPDNPRFTRRFEGYIFGKEVANAFSELNDPLEQRERFEQQYALRQAGDEEAHPFDEDFLLAMEYGMPPTGGLGIGIDRMAMLLTGADSIREVIFFPQMREG
ncbi:MAG: lysine--tRNA ligase [Armatimonadetes bacterium JP3_11]|jgi:lysyl-tRNA synthetase class 2|nr:MAG: lysine--tRNA ligase [Armatimonadetes bacterium CP1_7O]OYT75290.1 MAG: lysine--tRNA ligase [Armatimonadetes bacterium JP3_11]RMH09653.1 MAG: lysine--tRNA ligase [Armatimonadota bacterium]